MANVQWGEWNFILNFDISTVSSSLLDVFNVVETSNSSSKSSSLSILEVNLNLVVSHTFEHLFCKFEETDRFDISFVGSVEQFTLKDGAPHVGRGYTVRCGASTSLPRRPPAPQELLPS